jgi:hypothetical protein
MLMRITSALCDVELRLPLIDHLLRLIASREQRAGPIQLLRTQPRLADRLLLLGAHGRDAVLGLRDLRLRLPERGLQVACIHPRDHLSRMHHVAFVGQNRRDAARKLRVDIDLVGLEPSIGPRDPWRYCRPAMGEPPGRAARAGCQHHNCGERHTAPACAAGRRSRFRDHHRQAGTLRRLDRLG